MTRAPMEVLAWAAKTAPSDTLFVMAQPVTRCRHPREHVEVTLFAFTPDGIRSRTLESGPGGWSWLHVWGGDALPWREASPYDEGWTPDRARRWHEQAHGWYYVRNFTEERHDEHDQPD